MHLVPDPGGGGEEAMLTWTAYMTLWSLLFMFSYHTARSAVRSRYHRARRPAPLRQHGTYRHRPKSAP